MKNNYSIEKDIVYIHLQNKKGDKYDTLIDLNDLDKIKESNLKWHLFWSNTTKSYYAKATKYLGYLNGKPKYKTIYLHRFLTNVPSELYVDHINHNTLDNRKKNLNIVTNIENHENRENRCNRNSSTKCRNVSYIKKENIYIVQFQINRQNVCMGKFNTLEEAVKYANENRKYYYKNA